MALSSQSLVTFLAKGPRGVVFISALYALHYHTKASTPRTKTARHIKSHPNNPSFSFVLPSVFPSFFAYPVWIPPSPSSFQPTLPRLLRHLHCTAALHSSTHTLSPSLIVQISSHPTPSAAFTPCLHSPTKLNKRSDAPNVALVLRPRSGYESSFGMVQACLGLGSQQPLEPSTTITADSTPPRTDPTPPEVAAPTIPRLWDWLEKEDQQEQLFWSRQQQQQ